jgi:hypothetical protein
MHAARSGRSPKLAAGAEPTWAATDGVIKLTFVIGQQNFPHALMVGR